MSSATELDRLAAAQRAHAAHKEHAASNPFTGNPFAAVAARGPTPDERLVSAIETASMMMLALDLDRRETFARALGALLPRPAIEAHLMELGTRFLDGLERDRERDRERYSVGGPASGHDDEPPKS